MSEDTVFAKIIRREIPADIVYEDERAIAFRDIDPQAPVHVLVVPRESLEGLQKATADHEGLLGHLLLVAATVAEKEGVAADGYRCVVNAGPAGGQEVPHLHLHLLGGRQMGWPPG
jgi:histidine triad (HIT) family protein